MFAFVLQVPTLRYNDVEERMEDGERLRGEGYEVAHSTV